VGDHCECVTYETPYIVDRYLVANGPTRITGRYRFLGTLPDLGGTKQPDLGDAIQPLDIYSPGATIQEVPRGFGLEREASRTRTEDSEESCIGICSTKWGLKILF
jgi:hypothetical protein